MEQLDQLREMRDAAQIRVDEAKAAIDNGPDGKLVASLSALILDLEEQFGLSVAPEAEVSEGADDIAAFAAETELTGAEVSMDLAEAGAEDEVPVEQAVAESSEEEEAVEEALAEETIAETAAEEVPAEEAVAEAVAEEGAAVEETVAEASAEDETPADEAMAESSGEATGESQDTFSAGTLEQNSTETGASAV